MENNQNLYNFNQPGQTTQIKESPLNKMTTPEIEPPKTKSTGAIVGSIIIIVILVIGGLYLWGKQITKVENQQATTPEQILSEPDQALDSLKNQSTSDEIKSIEIDLNATNLDNLNKELENINIELGL
ncbi:MAG: hypothetical protein WC849_02555 [Candidatus Paceibacterota bacterium]